MSGKVIVFSQDYRNSYYKIIEELKNKKNIDYSYSDIVSYANRILKKSREFNPEKSHTLIVKITKKFGILVYQEKMSKKVLGFIKIGGDIQIKYKSDKVILLNKNIDGDVYFQRYVLANILAYYLFYYLGSDEQQNNKYFCKELKNEYFEMNKISHKFAMEILMPKKLFVEQYNVAVKSDNSYYFVLMYLSRYFKVNEKIVAQRLKEL